MSPGVTWDFDTPTKLQADEGLNDSDKTFTVPVGVEWEIMSIWAELVTAGGVGNREMGVEIQDNASDVLFLIIVGASQAASLTRNYCFALHNPYQTAFIGPSSDLLLTPLPNFILPAGYVVRVYDTAAIDAAADDMVLQMLVRERKVA